MFPVSAIKTLVLTHVDQGKGNFKKVVHCGHKFTSYEWVLHMNLKLLT